MALQCGPSRSKLGGTADYLGRLTASSFESVEVSTWRCGLRWTTGSIKRFVLFRQFDTYRSNCCMLGTQSRREVTTADDTLFHPSSEYPFPFRLATSPLPLTSYGSNSSFSLLLIGPTRALGGHRSSAIYSTSYCLLPLPTVSSIPGNTT